MNPPAIVRFALLLLVTAAWGCRGEPGGHTHRAPLDFALVGQLVLPEGTGSRGIEVQATTAPRDGTTRTRWVPFDKEGRFSHTFNEPLTGVTVTAGIGGEVYHVDRDGLPTVTPAGRIDLGVIDVRDRLLTHRLTVLAPDVSQSGVVRVAMCFGPPPTGPQGEPVSLGSRQFPPYAVGNAIDWLIPHDAHNVHFLVERPAGPGRGVEWRSGEQRLFGPFTTTTLPLELRLD